MLNDYVADFSAEMEKSIPKGIVGYFCIYLKRVLLDGKRIFKNDFLDSQMLYFYDSVLILSADKSFRSILKELDPAYYSKTEAVLAGFRV